MTGDTPQPGETPRSEGDPWSFGDPDAAWWRGETDRPADEPDRPRHPRRRGPQHQPAAGGTGTLLPPAEQQYTGAAAEAHAAAARDVAKELDPDAAARLEPAAVERDHDRPDPHRYDPLRPPARSTGMSPETVTADEDPDVMVLPEPNPRNRPTVPLDRGPAAVPGSRQAPGAGRPTEPLPPPTGSPATDARLEKLENSPFWRDEHEDTIEVPPPATVTHTAVRNHRSRRTSGRLPLSAHVSLVSLGLVAAFFGWVSAEPFWLAVGHGDRGYATTTQCTSSGVTQRCAGRFAAADGRYTVSGVVLLGVEPAGRAPGSTAPARMVSPDSRQAYLGSTGPLLHLRWVLGFALVLLCGYTVAGLTGARRLENGRARRGAVLLSLAGPLALLAGFLIAAY